MRISVPLLLAALLSGGCALPDDEPLPERLQQQNLVIGPVSTAETAVAPDVNLPDPPLGDGVLGLHKRLVRAKDFPSVVDLLNHYRNHIRTARDPVDVGHARYEMAVVYGYFFNDHERAVSLLTELWTEDPDHPRATLARYLAARLYARDLYEPERARILYRQLVALAPESFIGRIAREELDKLVASGDDEVSS